MRKLFYAMILVCLSQFGYGQAVNDQAVIPVSVTLNSILRLTVVSGGNIEFVVNTIDQYNVGINNGGTNTLYQTNFTVSSSQDFNVTLRAEDSELFGQDSSTTSMPLDNIGFDLTTSATATGVAGTNWTFPATVLPLTAVAVPVVTGAAGLAAGSYTQNDFLIRWRLGTQEGTMNGLSLLEQSLTPDRYTTNVFLELVPK